MIFKILEFWAIFDCQISFLRYHWYDRTVFFNWKLRLYILYLESNIAVRYIFKKVIGMQNCAQNHFYRLLGNKMWLLDTFQNLNICLNICCRAILDPKNKRFGSFLSTKKKQFGDIIDRFSRFKHQKWPKIQKSWKTQKITFLDYGYFISKCSKILNIWS